MAFSIWLWIGWCNVLWMAIITGALIGSINIHGLRIRAKRHSRSLPSTREANYTKNYCAGEYFKPACNATSDRKSPAVILIEKAWFGRPEKGPCRSDDSYLGCGLDVTSYMNQQCGGKTKCQFDVQQRSFPQKYQAQIDTCADRQSYLQVSYKCIKVESPPANASCPKGQQYPVVADRGAFASRQTREEGPGSAACPFLIKVQYGQYIRVSFRDLGPVTHDIPDGTTDHVKPQIYAIIREAINGSKPEKWGSCDNCINMSMSHTYKWHELVVEMNPIISNKNLMRNYIMDYEAIPCPLLSPVPYGWVTKTSNVTLLFGCNYGKEPLGNLTCNGTTWIGYQPFCTAPKQTRAVTTTIAVILVIIVVLLITVAAYCCWQQCSVGKRGTLVVAQPQETVPDAKIDFGERERCSLPRDVCVVTPFSKSTSPPVAASASIESLPDSCKRVGEPLQGYSSFKTAKQNQREADDMKNTKEQNQYDYARLFNVPKFQTDSQKVAPSQNEYDYAVVPIRTAPVQRPPAPSAKMGERMDNETNTNSEPIYFTLEPVETDRNENIDDDVFKD